MFGGDFCKGHKSRLVKTLALKLGNCREVVLVRSIPEQRRYQWAWTSTSCHCPPLVWWPGPLFWGMVRLPQEPHRVQTCRVTRWQESAGRCVNDIIKKYTTPEMLRKIAPLSSSRINECANSVTGTKSLKIRYYGARERNDIRVAAWVAQVNGGNTNGVQTRKQNCLVIVKRSLWYPYRFWAWGLSGCNYKVKPMFKGKITPIKIPFLWKCHL